MKPSPKFNHRHKFERDHATVIAANHFTTGAVDEDFNDLGERIDFAVAPNIVVHCGRDCSTLEDDVARLFGLEHETFHAIERLSIRPDLAD